MRASRHSAGFTLLEMLVVLVIIGLIASLVGPRLFSRVDSSKIQVAETQTGYFLPDAPPPPKLSSGGQ